MQINKALNLVLDVDRADGTKIFVHSTPIRREVFETYYLVIAKTFSAIYEEGLSRTSGPRVAAMMLKNIAKQMNSWDGPAGVEKGLFEEIRRLTLALVPTGSGWDQMPLHEAAQKGFLDEDDVSEVENALVFFTVAWQMHKKNEREAILRSVLPLWNASLTSSSATDYAHSSPTSTPAAVSADPAPSSSPGQTQATVTKAGSSAPYSVPV